jgi:hypothetical protein
MSDELRRIHIDVALDSMIQRRRMFDAYTHLDGITPTDLANALNQIRLLDMAIEHFVHWVVD